MVHHPHTLGIGCSANHIKLTVPLQNQGDSLVDPENASGKRSELDLIPSGDRVQRNLTTNINLVAHFWLELALQELGTTYNDSRSGDGKQINLPIENWQYVL